MSATTTEKPPVTRATQSSVGTVSRVYSSAGVDWRTNSIQAISAGVAGRSTSSTWMRISSDTMAS